MWQSEAGRCRSVAVMLAPLLCRWGTERHSSNCMRVMWVQHAPAIACEGITRT